jgi:hypothetical protein
MDVKSLGDVEWSDIVPYFVKYPYQIYKRRKLIQKLYKRFMAYTKMGRTNVVVLGRSSAGKTLLAKRLEGKIPSYKEVPALSTDVEVGAVGVGEWAKVIRVIPGQDGVERRRGLEEAFSTHNDLEGVIYVTDWGFTEYRDENTKQLLLDKGVATIETLRKYNLDRDIGYFRDVCELIKTSVANGRGPRWVVIAVSKADLFYDELNDARKYYLSSQCGGFVEELHSLERCVGTLHLPCKVVPVSAWREKFEWNGQVRDVQMADVATDEVLFRHFEYVLATLSARAMKRR